MLQLTPQFQQRKDPMNQGMRVELLHLFPHLLLKKTQIFLDPCPELLDSSLLQAPFFPVDHGVDQEQKMP